MGQIKALDRTVQKTHEWVHAVQRELKWMDERRAYTALRAVLRRSTWPRLQESLRTPSADTVAATAAQAKVG